MEKTITRNCSCNKSKVKILITYDYNNCITHFMSPFHNFGNGFPLAKAVEITDNIFTGRFKSAID